MLATYTVRIEADRNEAPVLLSNGDPVERGTLDGGKRHYAVWRDPHPKPCYLFALVGGNLASYASDFTTASGRKVDLRIYVEPGKEDRCAWAMDSLKRSMRWDEERFGREYDLDVFNIVAVSDFNMGAMENKGLNVFNDALILASPETATDCELRGNRAGDRARVLPQLDRQPHHLPRLVPAVPQGGPHRLPRPGVLRRPALRHGRAHPRRAQPEGGAVSRGRGPARPSRAPRPLHRDQQLLHGHRLQQGRRGRAHAADAAGARGLPQGHGPLLRAPRRAGGDGGGLRHLLRGRHRQETSSSS